MTIALQTAHIRSASGSFFRLSGAVFGVDTGAALGAGAVLGTGVALGAGAGAGVGTDVGFGAGAGAGAVLGAALGAVPGAVLATGAGVWANWGAGAVVERSRMGRYLLMVS